MPGSTEPKYIFVNGVMEINPKYVPDVKGGEPAKTTVADPKNSLAIISTMDDMAKASEAKQNAGAGPVQASRATGSSITIMQDSYYIDKFESTKPLDPGELVDGITSYFAKYEVPLGLVNKLLALLEYKMNFIIDDSGSMNQYTDASMKDATDYIKKQYDPNGKRANSYQHQMKRWEEAEDRLHIFIDMLAYVPTGPITFGFLNNKSKDDVIVLEHKGKTPDQFKEEGHKKISAAFMRIKPTYSTPILENLKAAFGTKEKVMHYLLTDGVPDESIESVKELVLKRANPEKNPLTFLSCTNVDSEADWMKEIEEKAPFTAELDDFLSERKEVQHDQGSTFPYSKGFWLLSSLVGAINPDDLDALDEDRPFSKKTMDDLMGRKLSDQEFRKYYDNHPLGKTKEYSDLYNAFSTEDAIAKKILEKHNPDLLNKSADDLLRNSYRPR